MDPPEGALARGLSGRNSTTRTATTTTEAAAMIQGALLAGSPPPDSPATGSPHEVQKRAPAGTWAPHDEHSTSSPAPQDAQNFPV